MPFYSVNCLCQIEKAREKLRTGWPSRPALFALAFIVILSFSKCASGSIGQLSSNPASISFGSVTVGVSRTSTVTLTNTGRINIHVSRAAVQGVGFSISGLALPLVLGVNKSATFTVQFHPEVTGRVTGDISIECGVLCSNLIISLSGIGIPAVPAASLSSTSLAFGSQAVGASSAAQTITLKDTGYASLSITNISFTGANPQDFGDSNNCGSSLVVGASCTISVTFTPAASGSFSAVLVIADNASGSPQTVTLSGSGASRPTNGSSSPGVSLSPNGLSFGNQPVDVASSSQTITLQNTTGASLSVSSIALTGADPADFTENNTCGTSVAAGGSCTIVTSFTPPAAGSLMASLSVTDNASGSPQTVALSGTGTHDVILSWSASSGAAGYDIYRGTSSGGVSSTPLNSEPFTGTTYDDTSVQAGQTYYYKITAVGSNGSTQSGSSTEVSATVPSS